MQQNKFSKINYFFNELIDVDHIVDFTLEVILHSCQIKLQEHQLVRAVPFYTQFTTFLLLSNIMKHYVSNPNSILMAEDCEPKPSQKESFTNQITINVLKKNYQPVEKENTQSSRFLRRSTNRMKTSTLSVVTVSKQPTKVMIEKEEIQIVKLKIPILEMDEQEKYYRYQHQQQQELLERIAKNQKHIEDQKILQKNQIDNLTKRKEIAAFGYDFDGSILPYNKPYLKTKSYQLQAKLLKKKQIKSEKHKPSIESILITNVIKTTAVHPHSFNEKTLQPNQTDIGFVQNLPIAECQSQEKQLEMLKHDTTLRMTKKQYQETSSIFIQDLSSQIQGKLNQTCYQEKKDSCYQEEETLERDLKTSVRNSRAGKINIRQNINILTQEQEDREIQLPNQVQNQILRKKTKNENLNLQLISFRNIDGKLPPLQSQQIKTIYGKQSLQAGRSKRSVTQYC